MATKTTTKKTTTSTKEVKKAPVKKTVSKKDVTPKKVVTKAETKESKVSANTPTTETVLLSSKVSIKDINKFFLESPKAEVIRVFSMKDGDTGSPEVQVALASHKITLLAAHLGLNPKDNHSRRGLLKIISKRRRILNYLASKDEPRYRDLIMVLQLKK